MLVRVLGKHAADEVVFGRPGDLVVLGSRTLEGLNYRVEPVTIRQARAKRRAARLDNAFTE